MIMIRHCGSSTLKHDATEVHNSFVDQSMKLEPPHVLSPRTGEAATLEKNLHAADEAPYVHNEAPFFPPPSWPLTTLYD